MEKILKEIVTKYNLEMGNKFSQLNEYKQELLNKLFEDETIDALRNINTNNKNIVDLRTILIHTKVYEKKIVIEEVRNKINEKIFNLVKESKFNELKELIGDAEIISNILNNTNEIEVQKETKGKADIIEIETKEGNTVDSEIEKIIEKNAEEEINRRIEEDNKNTYDYSQIKSYDEIKKITNIDIKDYENGERAVFLNKNGVIVIGKYKKYNESIKILKNSLIPTKNVSNNIKEEIKEMYKELREGGYIEVSERYFRVIKDIENVEIGKLTEFIVGEEVEYDKEWKSSFNRVMEKFKN